MISRWVRLSHLLPSGDSEGDREYKVKSYDLKSTKGRPQPTLGLAPVTLRPPCLRLGVFSIGRR